MADIRLPEGAAGARPGDIEEEKLDLPDIESQYIRNPFPGRELLSRDEAIDAISRLANMLLIDGYNRRHQPSKDEHRKHL